MKLKSAVLLSSALVSTAALAQGTAPAPATEGAAAAPAAAPVNKTLVPYGLLQGYVNLTDSTRQGTPDFAQYITRLGLKISEGIAKGQIELEVNRNNVGYKTIKSTPAGTNNAITVRRADVGLDLATKTSVRFGRYRLGNPEVWGVDATSTLDGFGGADGVMVSQGIDISEGNSVTVKAGVANAMSVPAADNYQYGSGVDFNVNTSSKALYGAIDAKVSGVSAGVYYGIDGRWKQGNADGTEKEASGTTIDTRRVQHLEAALGYNIDGLGGGVAYQQITRGEIKRYTNENGKLKSGAKLTAAERATLTDTTKADGEVKESLISIGVNGDSSLFGVTDIAQAGDKITYGASVAFKQTRNDKLDLGNATATKKAKDALEGADITEFALGAGYSAGGFTLELDYQLQQAKKKEFSEFTNAKGDKAEKARHKTYLTSVYVF